MEEKRTVWITGAGGLIGSQLCRLGPAFAPGWRIIGLARADLDLLDFQAVEERFRRETPDLIIHCAAMSKSPACQADPALAWRMNVDVTTRLARLGAEGDFVFFSTDMVFDGRKGNYVEGDDVNPLSIYGETKVAAEKIVLSNPLHTVVRVALNGGSSPTGDRSFTEEMRRNWEMGRSLKLFTDEFRTPLPAEATARAVWELAASRKPGIYHLGGSERLSRLEIGKLLAAKWSGLRAGIEAGSIRDYHGAPRPADTSLDSGKIQKLLSFPLPKFSEWIAGAA